MAENIDPTRSTPAVLQAGSTKTNSLRLSKRELDLLLDAMDAQDESEASSKRKYVRRRLRQVVIPVSITQPGGNSTTIAVACRNLSRAGIGVLHSSYQHVNAVCTVFLPLHGGKHLAVLGTVVRCQHVKGAIHELGMKFNTEIDTTMMLELDLLDDWFSLEQVAPEVLNGALLHVDSSAADRRLMRHHLRDTNLAITTAENGAEALERSAKPQDIIVCDSHLPDMAADELVSQLRARGVSTPVIVTTADDRAVVQHKVAPLGIQAVLSKPLDTSLLLRAIGEFLALGGRDVGTSAAHSTLADDHPNLTLLHDYIEDLHGLGDQLATQLASGTPETCRRLCLQVAGAAPAMGFAGIAEVAARAAKSLGESAAVKDSGQDVERLASLCKRASARKAA